MASLTARSRSIGGSAARDVRSAKCAPGIRRRTSPIAGGDVLTLVSALVLGKESHAGNELAERARAAQGAGASAVDSGARRGRGGAGDAGPAVRADPPSSDLGRDHESADRAQARLDRRLPAHRSALAGTAKRA